MILDVGIDLCAIDRIAATLDRFGARFLNRVYAVSEQERAERVPFRRVERYAQMFAAKEACAKALGTGLRHGVFWRDMALSTHPSGQPFLTLCGGAAARLRALTPSGASSRIDVSLSDEAGLAQAVVILSADAGERASVQDL